MGFAADLLRVRAALVAENTLLAQLIVAELRLEAELVVRELPSALECIRVALMKLNR